MKSTCFYMTSKSYVDAWYFYAPRYNAAFASRDRTGERNHETVSGHWNIISWSGVSFSVWDWFFCTKTQWARDTKTTTKTVCKISKRLHVLDNKSNRYIKIKSGDDPGVSYKWYLMHFSTRNLHYNKHKGVRHEKRKKNIDRKTIGKQK